MSTALDTTVPAQLRALVRLQYFDSKLDDLKKLRGDLPDEIRDLEDEKTGLETRVRNFQHDESEGTRTLSDAEAQMRDSEAQIKRYTDQQSTVRNNREYDTLTKEIEAQRQRIIDAQARIDEVTNARPVREEATAAAHARMAEIGVLLETKRGELTSVMEETKSETDERRARRDEAAEDVDAAYRRGYERLRTRLKDGRAVVPLERGAAGGYAVPPQRQIEVGERIRILNCEHTGRIIVDAELFHEVTDVMRAAEGDEG